MSPSAMHTLGWRMARRNNLYLFAWMCAILLPLGLQWLAGFQEDVRDYLDAYYGPFTLYFFFVMTYGFATIFVSYYQLSGYRRQGTLDMLRVARLTPGEVLWGVYAQLQRILIPPIAGFAVVFAVYLLLSPEREQVRALGSSTIMGGMANVLFTEGLLSAVICLGLLRGEAALALLSSLLVLPLNVLPIALLFWADNVRDRALEAETEMPALFNAITAVPWLFYALILTLLIAVVLLVARARLAALWPPQVRPPKGG